MAKYFPQSIKLYHKTSNRKKNYSRGLEKQKKSCCISHRENAFKTFGWKCNKNRLSSHSLRGLQHICIRNRHQDAHSVENRKINSHRKMFREINYFDMISITLSYLVNVDTYSHLCSFYYIKNVCSSEIITLLMLGKTLVIRELLLWYKRIMGKDGTLYYKEERSK